MAEDLWPEKPEAKRISQIKAWKYDKRAMDAWLEKVSLYIGNLHQDIADHEETERNWLEQEKAYMSCIDELKKKADLWDHYAIYDNDKEEEILVKDLITVYEKIEAIKPLYEAYNTEPRVDTFEDYCIHWLKDILGAEA